MILAKKQKAPYPTEGTAQTCKCKSRTFHAGRLSPLSVRYRNFILSDKAEKVKNHLHFYLIRSENTLKAWKKLLTKPLC